MENTNNIGVDLIGEAKLYLKSHRTKPFIKWWWGQAVLPGAVDSHSYYLHLTDQDTASPGDVFQAEFKFKFSEDERFKIKVSVGQIIILQEGRRDIGEILVQEIVNQKLLTPHK